MISIEQQEQLFSNISKRLKKEITAYAIGGTAMMFLGIKDVTLDIDLVFENKNDREAFIKAAEELGYKIMDSVEIYGDKSNTPIMLKLEDERFDLFIDKVIYFMFSKEMKKRTDSTHQFGKNLILKIANPHDIILMKCATDRLKDKDDVRKIINTTKIDWNILIDEAENQVKLGQERALFDLGDFLETLKLELKVPIPQKVINELFEKVKKQAEKKKLK